MLGESEVFVSASLGVSLPTNDGAPIDAETLVRDADTAMYQAKEHGRNSVRPALQSGQDEDVKKDCLPVA